MTHPPKSQLLSVALVITVGFLAISECDAANYYIDSVGGNDENIGLSTNAASKSHTMVENAKLQPGDTVRFVNGGESDYHLSRDSRLRGAALNLSQDYSKDFEDNPLPDDGPWDVGAFQYRGK